MVVSLKSSRPKNKAKATVTARKSSSIAKRRNSAKIAVPRSIAVSTADIQPRTPSACASLSARASSSRTIPPVVDMREGTRLAPTSVAKACRRLRRVAKGNAEATSLRMRKSSSLKGKIQFGRIHGLQIVVYRTHMGNSDIGMTNVRRIDSPVQIGNGKTLRATKIGRKHLTVLSKDGTKTNIVLEDYKYVPDLWVNLFAVTKCLRNGWKISNDGITLYLRKGQSEVKFDKAIKTHKGLIIGVDMVPRVPDVANVAYSSIRKWKDCWYK